MRHPHYVGLDVHCRFTQVAVISESGHLLRQQECPTTIPAIVQALESVRRPLSVALEEGPLADWISRNVAPHVDEVTVCDPRRNQLIAKDSDKDDSLDAGKLAQLLRGGFLKPVHHADSLARVIFKQHVALYHDCVRQRVRTANRIVGLLSRHGVCVREKAFSQHRNRQGLISRLPAHPVLHKDLKLLWQAYDLSADHVTAMRRRLKHLALQEEPIRRFVFLPGVKWIRAATFYAYIDTPERFASKQKLWKYAGLGLQRRQSGSRKQRVSLAHRANRMLKYVLLGAARSAVVRGNNPFASQYRTWLAKGKPPAVALRNTARSLATTLWAMWKSGASFRPDVVGVPPPQEIPVKQIKREKGRI